MRPAQPKSHANPRSRLVAAITAIVVATIALASCSTDDPGRPAFTGDPSKAVPSTEASDPSGDEAGPADEAATPRAPFHTVAEAVAWDQPVVLAHAGGENAHPHSTMFAYGSAVTEGVDILDFDVRLTKDGELVIFHDDTVDRTTNGTGRVDEMTWEELHALDAAHWYTDECSACTDQPEDAYIYRGIRTGDKEPPAGFEADDFAPTRLVDVIERFPGWVLNIEMKGSYPDDTALAEKLAQVLDEHDLLDSAIVTAFDDALAEQFHQLEPRVAITPGLQAMTSYVLLNEKLPEGRVIVQIPPEYDGIELLTPEFVERAHGDGLVLWIWPNERRWENFDGYLDLLDVGVDGLNAANPPEAVRAVDAFSAGD